VVFDLSVFDYDRSDVAYKGYTVYRAHRIPDLYGHPAAPVQDLSVKIQDSFSELFFSGDPFLSYHVQASADLKNWEDLGQAELDSDGNGRFQEIDSREPSVTRFYRVVTE
jgi:hypothetical protein